MDNINDIGRSISNSFGISSIKNKIVEGIKIATAKLGVKLVAEEWGTAKNDSFSCACALGCMILANDGNLSEEDTDHNEKVAAEMLGVDKQWVTGFIYGFDGSSLDEGNRDAFLIGKEIRKEFNIDSKDDEEEYDDSDDGEDHF